MMSHVIATVTRIANDVHCHSRDKEQYLCAAAVKNPDGS